MKSTKTIEFVATVVAAAAAVAVVVVKIGVNENANAYVQLYIHTARRSFSLSGLVWFVSMCVLCCAWKIQMQESTKSNERKNAKPKPCCETNV